MGPQGEHEVHLTRDGETYGFLWPGGKVFFQLFPGSAERTHRKLDEPPSTQAARRLRCAMAPGVADAVALLDDLGIERAHSWGISWRRRRLGFGIGEQLV